jgi:rod shape-determining protein MreC
VRPDLRRWRRWLILAGLLALLLGLLRLGAERKAAVESAAAPTLSAALAWPSKAAAALRESWQGLGRLRDADKEAQRLKAENTLLKLQLAEARERLGRLAPRQAGSFEWSPRPAIPALILARDPSTWFNYITLDKGEDDGVRAGMGVVAPDGVVGKVVAATGTTSKMVFLMDPSCRIAVRAVRSRVGATLVGSGRRGCVLQYLAGGDDVKVGDLVETASEGSIFPPGVPVGQVSRVEKREAGLNLFAEVRPYVRPSMVQEVYVLGAQP